MFGRNKSEDASEPGKPSSSSTSGPGSPRPSSTPPGDAAPPSRKHDATPSDAKPSPATAADAKPSVAPRDAPRQPNPQQPRPADPTPDRRPEPRSDGGGGADARPARPAPGMTEKNTVRRTRVSGLWIGLVVAAVLAVFLLIFIAQNSEDVAIKFLGWEGQAPLAVAMLAGAVVAVLIVAVPGSLRIAQLRRALRKNVKNSST